MSQRPATIIVPTRNRADTLRSTLATCTMQDYEPLEILVSDNCSDDNTADVVSAARDHRVRHIRTPQRLGMSQNWEFALGHVERGVVIVVGDDDGLLPNAVRDIARLLDETGCEAVAWREAKYRWRGWDGGDGGNSLRIPLRTGWRVEDSDSALRRVLAGHSYRTLPSLYWGAVDRAALNRATSKSGTYFHSLNPDVYSAFATTMVVDRFVWSERPYRINGQSRHSTGVSFAKVEASAHSPRNLFLAESNLPFHRDYVLVPSPPVYVAEAYAQAIENVPDARERPRLAVETVVEQMMRAAAVDSAAAYALVADGVREIARRAGRIAVADDAIARYPHGTSARRGPIARVFGRGLGRLSVTLDGDDFAVSDVHGAAVLCHTIVRLFEADYFSPAGLARRVARAVTSRLGTS